VTDNDGGTGSDSINITITPNQSSNDDMIKLDFFPWGRSLSSSLNLRGSAGVDSGHTGFGCRVKCNVGTFLETAGDTKWRLTPDVGSYIITYFDSNGSNSPNKSIDLSGADAVARFSFNVGASFKYKTLLFDGSDWFIADDNVDYSGGEQNFLVISQSSWKKVNESSDITSNFVSGGLPTMTFSSGQPDFTNIQGMGVYVSEKPNSGIIRLGYMAVYSDFKPCGVYAGTSSYDVSPYLFGLCTTGGSWKATDTDMWALAGEWAEIIRFPGGLANEVWDHKHKSGTSTSCGIWMDHVRSVIPDAEFVVGVSSILGMIRNDVKPEDISDKFDNEWKPAYGGTLPTPAEFGGGLVDYLNINYNQAWGDNPARTASANLKFLEIGNEWEGGFYLKGMNPAVPDHADLYHRSFEAYYNEVSQVDPSVKLMGPVTMKTAIDGLLKEFMKLDGDKVDILTTHRYDNNPASYKTDIKILHDHIERYGVTNSRRNKDDIKIAYSEYNAHMDGTLWELAIWHSQVFSYFIKGGVYISTVWHVNMGSEHRLYQNDSSGNMAALPVHYSLKFFHDHIDFSKHPKVIESRSRSTNLNITAVEMDDSIVLFVVNKTDTSDSQTISFNNSSFANSAQFDVMTEGSNGQWAIGVVNNSNITLNSNSAVTCSFPKKSISAITVLKQ
jgi:hypothetical protein